MVKQTMVFSQQRDDRGYFYRAIHLEDDGSLVIEGHDLGSGVGDFFGGDSREYEFSRTIKPPGVARLQELSGVDAGNLLDRAARPVRHHVVVGGISSGASHRVRILEPNWRLTGGLVDCVRCHGSRW